MIGLRAIKDREYLPKKQFVSMVVVGMLSLSKILIMNAGVLKQLNSTLSKDTPYIRPSREYTIPGYHADMQYCDRNEKYLRPTLFCNSHAPEIVALAHHLGAFDLSEYDFAVAAHEFAKRQLKLEIMALDGVEETLACGTGTCLQINSVFVALCRAAGIKARYKLFSARQTAAMYDDVYDAMAQHWYDALGFFSLEADIEVYIDGQWLLANVAPIPDRQAAMGSPISKLGEGSLGNWFEAVPGTLMGSESLPFGIGLLSRLLMRVAPSSVNKINVNLTRQRDKGATILSQAGGEERYDAQIREKRTKMPTLELIADTNIVFR